METASTRLKEVVEYLNKEEVRDIVSNPFSYKNRFPQLVEKISKKYKELRKRIEMNPTSFVIFYCKNPCVDKRVEDAYLSLKKNIEELKRREEKSMSYRYGI